MGGKRAVLAQNIITDWVVEMRMKRGLRRWGREGLVG